MQTKNCKTCEILNPNGNCVVNNFNIVFDMKLNCKSENIIYIFTCKHCNSFYIGQTTQSASLRCNGHRTCFKNEIYIKSAVSQHIYEEHRNLFNDKLNNYNLAIIKKSSAQNLDRLEDFYIKRTRADITKMNRYKVLELLDLKKPDCSTSQKSKCRTGNGSNLLIL